MSTLKAVDLQHPSAAAANISLASSGNVGIGTSSPGVYTGYTTLAVNNATTGGVYDILSNGTRVASFFSSNVQTTLAAITNIPLSFRTNNTEAMRIDSSGNVGIGTSSPGYKVEVSAASASNGIGMRIANSGSTGAGIDFLQSGVDSFSMSMPAGTGGLRFVASGSNERMRIDSSGNLLVRTTTAGGLLTIDSVTGGTSSTKVSVFGYGSGLGYGIEFRPNTNTGATPCRFLNAAGTEVGFISTSSSGTTYSTTSDYRLKHTVAPLTIGLATVSALNPVTYKWNVDDSNGEGFIAHELQSVIPLAVTGEKDAVNEDGSIKPQGVDYSKIVVHLVAAIQELKAQNDALKARVATLEAK